MEKTRIGMGQRLLALLCAAAVTLGVVPVGALGGMPVYAQEPVSVKVKDALVGEDVFSDVSFEIDGTSTNESAAEGLAKFMGLADENGAPVSGAILPAAVSVKAASYEDGSVNLRHTSEDGWYWDSGTVSLTPDLTNLTLSLAADGVLRPGKPLKVNAQFGDDSVADWLNAYKASLKLSLYKEGTAVALQSHTYAAGVTFETTAVGAAAAGKYSVGVAAGDAADFKTSEVLEATLNKYTVTLAFDEVKDSYYYGLTPTIEVKATYIPDGETEPTEVAGTYTLKEGVTTIDTNTSGEFEDVNLGSVGSKSLVVSFVPTNTDDFGNPADLTKTVTVEKMPVTVDTGDEIEKVYNGETSVTVPDGHKLKNTAGLKAKTTENKELPAEALSFSTIAVGATSAADVAEYNCAVSGISLATTYTDSYELTAPTIKVKVIPVLLKLVEGQPKDVEFSNSSAAAFDTEPTLQNLPTDHKLGYTAKMYKDDALTTETKGSVSDDTDGVYVGLTDLAVKKNDDTIDGNYCVVNGDGTVISQYVYADTITIQAVTLEDGTDYTLEDFYEDEDGTIWTAIENGETTASIAPVETVELSTTADGTYANASLTPEYTNDNGENTFLFFGKRSNGVIGSAEITFYTDSTAPELEKVTVSGADSDLMGGVDFENENTTYHVEANDGEGSGIALVQYAVSDEPATEPNALAWTDMDDSADIDLTVATKSYVYLHLVDNVGNETYNDLNKFGSVIEDEAPTVEFNPTTSDVYTNTMQTIEVTIEDGPEDKFSGVQSVSFSLENADGTTENVPATMSATLTSGKTDAFSGGDLPDETYKTRVYTVDVTPNAGFSGTVNLVVVAKDYCGNETEESHGLPFDTKAADVTVSLDGNKNYKNANVNYYNKDGMKLTVLFEDDQLTVGGDKTAAYTVSDNGTVIGTYDGVDDDSWTLSADGKKLTFTATLAEGRHSITTSATDTAGNTTSEFAAGDNLYITEHAEEEDTAAAFVLDSTAPEAAYKVVTQVNAKADKTRAPLFYYNTRVYTEVTITDTHFDANNIGFVLLKNGTALEDVDYSWDGNVATVAMPEDCAEYQLQVYGTDKAGNVLKVKDTTLAAAAGTETVTLITPDDSEEAVSCGKLAGAKLVFDNERPQVKVTYTDVEAKNIYENENNTVYYNKDFAATFSVSDNYPLTAAQISATETKPVGTDVQKVTDGSKTSSLVFKVGAAQKSDEGSYRFVIKGYDRAGNAIQVAEYLTSETLVERGLIKVYDVTAPTYTADVTDPGAEHVLGTAAYVNRDIATAFSIEEVNFDNSRIGSACVGKTEDGDYGSYQPQWVNVTGGAGVDGTTYRQKVSADGVYRFEIAGEDKAGNKLVPSAAEAAKTGYEATVKHGNGEYWTYNKVRDTKYPEADLLVGDYYEMHMTKSGNQVVKSEPYRKETKAQITLEITKDNSPVKLSYDVTSSVNAAQNRAADYKYMQSLETGMNGQQIFCVENALVTDIAGNSISLTKSNSIYLDVTAPTMDELAPTISVVANAIDSGNGPDGQPLFDSDVPLSVKVSDPYGGERSSGLNEVKCELFINDNLEETRTLRAAGQTSWEGNYQDPTLEFSKNDTVTVEADKYNYNDLLIRITATDNAGNSNTIEYRFGIDTTAPTIEIDYDNNDAMNSKYFKADRVATITVTERNFDPDRMNITTESTNLSGWTRNAGGGNGDDDQWVANLTYNVDGVYTLTVDGSDLLGHAASSVVYNGVAPQDFVLDKTAPVLTLNFDRNDPANGKYYNTDRTATLSVDDVNFDGTASISVTAQEGSAPGFAFGGGRTATATFSVDGIYSISGNVTDMAGNVSNDVTCDEFVIDQTVPEVVFHDVEDMTAYGKSETAFRPYASIEDTNFDSSEVNVTLEYSHWDSQESKEAFGSLVGTDYRLNTLEETPENDGVYTFKVEVTDLAGNTNELPNSVTFSLNRFGSVYVLSEATNALLERYYTDKAPELSLTEYNLSEKADSWIDVSRNSEDQSRLTQGEGYTLQQAGDPGNDCNWKKTDYTIAASNFEQDGKYVVTVYAKDTLGNATTNVVPADEKYSADIEFCKDSEGPNLILTGPEEGEIYNESSLDMRVEYYDNTEMDRLNVTVVNADDEKEVLSSADYTVDDGTLEADAGQINYTVTENTCTQKVIVTAYDRAGNAAEEKTVSFILTTNGWIRFYKNKPVFFGSIAGAVAVVGGILLLVVKKRNKNDEETEEHA